MIKRFSIILLSLLLLFSLSLTAMAAETDGSFILTVCNANSMIIEPVRIPYKSGQTVKEALLESGYEFTGLEERGFIEAVEGVVANYVILYDGGGYQVDAPASNVTAIRIGVTNVDTAYQNDMLELIKAMAAYNEMENNVQNYPDAISAYKNALNGIRGDGSIAASLMNTLNNAISSYEAIFKGAKYTVTVSAQQNGIILQAPVFTLTDAYGNESTTTGTSLQVVAGEYSFCVSDGGYNRTEGTITVSSSTSFETTIPSGEWFGGMSMCSYHWKTGDDTPYRCEQDTENHMVTFWVDDSSGGYYGTKIFVEIGADVPNTETTKLRTIYVSVDGEDFSEKSRSWNWDNYMDSLVAPGMEGATFSLEGQYTDENGHVQIQSYAGEVIRIPTLTALTVVADGTTLPLEFDSNTWEYSLTTVSDTLDITASPYSDGYAVTGGGEISVGSGTSVHNVAVTAENGMSSTYTLNITKETSVDVTLDVPDGTSVVVTNTAGSAVAPVDGVYRLIPGTSYTYTATKNTYYHTTASFVASAGLKVSVAEPITTDWLSKLGIYSGSTGSIITSNLTWISYESDKTFTPSTHEYTYYVPDCNTSLYSQATASTGSVYACYYTQSTVSADMHEQYTEMEITNKVLSNKNAQFVTKAIAACGYDQEITMRVLKAEGDVTYYQDYYLTIDKQLHLYDMALSTADETLPLFDTDGNSCEFDRDIYSYSVNVNRDVETIYLSGEFPSEVSDSSDSPVCGGYYLIINGTQYSDISNISIPLDTQQDTETVTIQVCHVDESAIEGTYTLTVEKTDPVAVTISVNPVDTVIFLTNDLNGKRIYQEDGVFYLTPGGSYSYVATCSGYVGVEGHYTVPEVGGTISISLEKAPENTELVNLTAQWPHLRLDNNNNGIIDDPTPIDSEEAVLYWATKIGDGFDSNACSPPILVDGYLYVYAGPTIYKVDAQTGTIVATGEMDHSSSFGINPPTYADGMIFVGQSGGTVQAFNAVTLESLWIYRDPLSGQPNCSIVYHDGYVYTGFWNGETLDANYVCISATDEDPSNTMEQKLARWTYSSPGGFYWAGAYVCDNFLLVGTDDGDSGYVTGHPRLLSFDTDTGELLDEVTMSVTGDIRSSITQYNGKYYFTSKGGYFFEASVDAAGNIQQVRTLKLYNYADDANNPAMSTCTPTIYNGRAYIGVSGTSQFGAYSGHNITVIDINNWEIAYTVRTQGYPQTSGVLTTAYEKEDGSVYVYFFDNYTPGKLRVLKDKPGQTSATLVSIEGSYQTALNLFQPVGEQAEYALCSPIVDEYGTIYFKNDSARLMAVGSTIESLEVVQEPDKLVYKEGETFDSTGLQVIAHYTNGLSRDVTQYMTWSEEPLTADATDFQLTYPIVMYQNKDGQAGVEYPEPIAVVSLTIESAGDYGDVNGDGLIDLDDEAVVFEYCDGTILLTEEQFVLADVSGDGLVTLEDADIIYLYCSGEILVFPVTIVR